VLFQITSQRIVAGDSPAASAVAWHEFVRGSVTEEDITRANQVLDGKILQLDRATAEMAANLFKKTGSRRASTADCLIAATAILAGATLLTANQDDFERFEIHGLKLLSP
jgi:predicted nucleic acid-binding protein